MKPVLQLRLDDGDDIVIVKACNAYPAAATYKSRVMDSSKDANNDANGSDDDEMMNESLSNVRAAAKGANYYPNSSQMSKAEIDDKNRPKIASRPPSAFCLFFRDYEKVLKANRPNVTMAELQKLAMQNWEAMDSSSKNRYIEENSRLKEEYDRSLSALETNTGGKTAIQARTCRGFGCSKPAVENKFWDRDFCGPQCVVSYCREVFTQWVDDNKKRSAP